MNNLRFLVPELIFNPSLIGLDEGGVHEGIISMIKEANPDYKNLFYNNIILSGGNTKFFNFKDRLSSELIPLSDNQINIFDFDSQVQNLEPVISGMKLFSNDIDYLKDISISKEEYEEVGFNIVWKNCF
jgi:actin-related protein